MATDSNGLTYENRTLNFYGEAFGESNVSLTAVINSITVFSGEVPTVNQPLPYTASPTDNLLFSISESSLFPTNWAGSYPMSVTVTGGSGIVFGKIYCNYMMYGNTKSIENSTIEDTTLTIGTINSGTVTIGDYIVCPEVLANTIIVSGSDTTWTVNNSQSVPSTAMTLVGLTKNPGISTNFGACYQGIPTNSEGTMDPRTNVKIDGVQQVPPLLLIDVPRPWIVPTNSTIEYNLNVRLGNCAQI